MKLEIKNLQTSATYEIDPEGAVLGREGAKADIVLRDQAVSKKHAKIYEKNGRWLLEDLASSNGTFIDNRRITEPVQLTPGLVFALSENQFEVLQIIGAANGKAAFAGDSGSHDGSYQDPLDDLPPLGMTSGDESMGEGKKGGRGAKGSAATGRVQPSRAPIDDEDEGDGAEEQGVGYFLKAVPKAIAYYIVAVPLMALNPPGTIRKGIEEQKFPAMKWMALAAYAIPAFAFAAALSSLASFLALLFTGNFGSAVLTLIPGLPIAVAIAIVVSLVSGFISHPVLKWIIEKLKGESDEKSRTNYVIMSYATSILLALPSALVIVLAAVPLPFIGVVPAVIGVAAAIVSFFLHYNWWKHFQVVKWAQTVILVLLVLGIANAAWGVVSSVRYSIASLGSGGTSAVAAGVPDLDDPNLTDEQKELIRQSQEALKAAGAAGVDAEAIKKAQEEAAKAMAASAEAVRKAQEEAMKAGGASAEAIEAARKAAEEATAAAQKQAAEAAANAEAAAKQAAESAEKAGAETAAKAEEVAAKAEEAAKAAESAAKKAAVVAETSAKKAVMTPRTDPSVAEDVELTPFEQFLNKREAIYKSIERDPFLVKKQDIADRYERLLRATDEVRQRWAKKKAKDFAQSKINDRLKDIEVYEATSKMVDQLYAKLFPGQ